VRRKLQPPWPPCSLFFYEVSCLKQSWHHQQRLQAITQPSMHSSLHSPFSTPGTAAPGLATAAQRAYIGPIIRSRPCPSWQLLRRQPGGSEQQRQQHTLSGAAPLPRCAAKRKDDDVVDSLLKFADKYVGMGLSSAASGKGRPGAFRQQAGPRPIHAPGRTPPAGAGPLQHPHPHPHTPHPTPTSRPPQRPLAGPLQQHPPPPPLPGGRLARDRAAGAHPPRHAGPRPRPPLDCPCRRLAEPRVRPAGQEPVLWLHVWAGGGQCGGGAGAVADVSAVCCW